MIQRNCDRLAPSGVDLSIAGPKVSRHMMMCVSLVLMLSGTTPCFGQDTIDVSGFQDSRHHWYDIADEDKVIQPLPDQPVCKPSQIREIADNILLYQKLNGGWPKNYDMLAILTPGQKKAIEGVKGDSNTTFDNGSTHSQVEYLARAYQKTKDIRYRDACLRGLDFILAAQYPNGGWPQFYPDSSGYRKYITFNDGAMTGVMTVLHEIVKNDSIFNFVDIARRQRVARSFWKGVDCILKCQVVQNGVLTAWGQQHDNIDLRPQDARNFEPASLSGRESGQILLFLMDIKNPGEKVVASVNSAVRWLVRSTIRGIRVDEVKAPVAHYKYRTTVDYDRVIVEDPQAPPIWTRMYELGTNRPLFCNRDKKPVYTLAEVDRERRAGYTWYSYLPAEVLDKYPEWKKQWSPNDNALAK